MNCSTPVDRKRTRTGRNYSDIHQHGWISETTLREKRSERRMLLESCTYRKIKSMQAKLHKILFRDMCICYEDISKRKEMDHSKFRWVFSYLERGREVELTIKKGNTKDFKDVIFYFSSCRVGTQVSFCLSYLHCIHTLCIFWGVNVILHKNLQRLYN